MIYIYDYNNHELVGEYNSQRMAARLMGLPNVNPVVYNCDRITKGFRVPVIHRKKGIAVYITSEKISND